jgi:hypothetical protein
MKAAPDAPKQPGFTHPLRRSPQGARRGGYNGFIRGGAICSRRRFIGLEGRETPPRFWEIGQLADFQMYEYLYICKDWQMCELALLQAGKFPTGKFPAVLFLQSCTSLMPPGIGIILPVRSGAAPEGAGHKALIGRSPRPGRSFSGAWKSLNWDISRMGKFPAPPECLILS